MSIRLQLAEIDYTVVHSSLIKKCMESYPDAVPKLTEDISQWDSVNSSALKKLKERATDVLEKKLGLPEAEAITRSAQVVAMMTNGLKAQVEKVSGSELKAACAGDYAATLQSPMLNFSELLEALVQPGKID